MKLLDTSKTITSILQEARRLGRGTYLNRLRAYEYFKRQIQALNLDASAYAQAIQELADALKV